jgi:serine/threonine protein kinase/Tfp pilus assembly protein PilF
MDCPACHTKNSETSRFCSSCGARLFTEDIREGQRTQTLQSFVEELTRGTTFAKRYEVIEKLGKGGMGEVYRVFDSKIEEEVALKLLNPEIAIDKRTTERFKNEIKYARKIGHKHVCKLYDLNEQAGLTFITMEYVPGEDLKSFIKRSRHLSTHAALVIAKQVCEGLSEAHRLGVVHRDLKPSNIMIDKNGNAKIMDFGIARSVRAKGITGSGTLLGTPEYMSPEQAEGKDIDPRTDIYSFGIILYEMVTGRVPFDGDTPFTIGMKHAHETPKNPTELNIQIPLDLSRIILKCLEKDRGERYQDAQELYSDLEKLEKEIPTTAKFAIRRTGPQKWAIRQKAIMKWAALFLVIAVISYGGFRLWKGLSSPKKEYENFISIEFTAEEAPDLKKNLIEYLLLRDISASTRINVIAQEDLITFKKKTESVDEKYLEPLITINSEIYPKLTGFVIFISVRNRNKTSQLKKFESKGYFDLLTNKIKDIHSFIVKESDGIIGQIEGNRTFAQICTDNIDALEHFLDGESARKKLDPDRAISKYRAAIENDPQFSLARLKMADIQIFMTLREEARQNLQEALKNKHRLIKLDLIRLRALMSRINFNPITERQYIRQLIEAYPFNQEYHYEFAESYFHCGDAEEAIRHYLRALELDSNYAKAHNHIGFCYAWLGNHSSAEKHFRKYVDLDETANSYDSLACGYMFAGRYNEAIDALDKGMEIDPNLDYLYWAQAGDFILIGALEKAKQNLQRELQITKNEQSKADACFYLAYLELLRENLEKSGQYLNLAIEHYSDTQYENTIDDFSSLPFWLEGVVAIKNGDLQKIRSVVEKFEKKIADNGVNATNYFGIYKFYIHLKMQEALLNNNEDEIDLLLEEGMRIKNRMGYWNTIFDLSYFYVAYAEVLTSLARDDEALDLLNAVIAYNPSYAAAHLKIAQIQFKQNKKEQAQQAYQKAMDILSEADQDFILIRQAGEIRKSFEYME